MHSLLCVLLSLFQLYAQFIRCFLPCHFCFIYSFGVLLHFIFLQNPLNEYVRHTRKWDKSRIPPPVQVLNTYYEAQDELGDVRGRYRVLVEGTHPRGQHLPG